MFWQRYREDYMPTEAKAGVIEELKTYMEGCTIAISTDYSGLNVSDMNLLRTTLRNKDITYKVVKNTLFKRAADESDRPELKELVDQNTGIIFGYGDEQIPAKIISEFIKETGSELTINAGVIGTQILSAEELDQLAKLPGKDELVAKLIGQLHGQLAGLVFVLNSPISGFARVLNGPVTGLTNVLNARAQQN
tara:strand:- start:28 stop:606 length:579 start_codon:yes stop_codon:yes gene_type:complete